jgi:hypothetical protein
MSVAPAKNVYPLSSYSASLTYVIDIKRQQVITNSGILMWIDVAMSLNYL